MCFVSIVFSTVLLQLACLFRSGFSLAVAPVSSEVFCLGHGFFNLSGVSFSVFTRTKVRSNPLNLHLFFFR